MSLIYPPLTFCLLALVSVSGLGSVSQWPRLPSPCARHRAAANLLAALQNADEISLVRGLGDRLGAVKELVTRCGGDSAGGSGGVGSGRGGMSIADIGADHALLAVDLVRDGIADRAIAIDVAEEPLER